MFTLNLLGILGRTTLLLALTSLWWQPLQAARVHRLLQEPGQYAAHDAAFQVIIGYHNPVGRAHLLGNFSIAEGAGLRRVQAVTAVVTWDDLERLREDPDLAYIEPDVEVEALDQLPMYGLDLIGVDQFLASDAPPPRWQPPDGSSMGDCSSPDSFKIAIVDSGLYLGHPDLTFCGADNCIGNEFSLDAGNTWDTPTAFHGTFVAGILGAANNDIGVRGVLARPQDICWIIARVFPDGGNSNTMSAILNGIEWAAEQGAHIINLSLGTPVTSEPAETLYQDLYNDGVLTIAAAGNYGDSSYTYPAAYDTVLSVSAVHRNESWAEFSTHNEQVNVAAPGVEIYSTAPLDAGYDTSLLVYANGTIKNPLLLRNSPLYTEVEGTLVDCGIADAPCSNANGKICVIQLDYVSVGIDEKATNCEQGGGVAAIIYHDLDQGMRGYALWDDTAVTIPVIGVKLSEGQALLAAVGKSASLQSMDGYKYSDGTSYSAPYVAGAAATIWMPCPQCSSLQVWSCLETSAKDLGRTGFDIYYGHGLVQIEPAFDCLVEQEQCCTARPTPSPTPVPTTSRPTASPTRVPTGKPSQSPTPSPTATPSRLPTPGPTSSPTKPPTLMPSTIAPTYRPTLKPNTVKLAPTSSPSTAAPTICPDQVEAFDTCLVTFIEQASTCRTCVESQLALIYEGGGDACTSAETFLCSDLPFFCPSCASCFGAIKDMVECVYGDVHGCNNVDCQGGTLTPTPAPTRKPTTHKPTRKPSTAPVVALAPSSTPVASVSMPIPDGPTLAPSPYVACQIEETAYQQCFAEEFDYDSATACRDCIIARVPAGSFVCSYFHSEVCDALYSECDCGPCEAPLEDYIGCVYEDTVCDLDCSELYPNGKGSNVTVAVDRSDEGDGATISCVSEMSDYALCLMQMYATEKNNCEACVSAVTPSAASDCNELQGEVCSQLLECDCGVCSDAVEQLKICQQGGGLDGNCTIDCLENIAMPVPTVAPVNPVAGGAPSASTAPQSPTTTTLPASNATNQTSAIDRSGATCRTGAWVGLLLTTIVVGWV